jgi:hypothetical protein
MRLLTLLFALLVASPALGQVRFMAIGDPQVGRGCSGSGYGTHPNYSLITYKQCMRRQARQFRNVIEYGVARNVDFHLILGDLVEANAGGCAPDCPQDKDSYNRTVIGDVLDDFPNETFYMTAGNHDYEACTNSMRAWVINPTNRVTGVRNNLWDAWSVRNVYFFTLNAALAGVDHWKCQDNTNYCKDIDGSGTTSCTSGGVTDNEGLGTGGTPCASDEVCEDYDGYAADMMTAFDAHADAYIVDKAAGTANMFIAFGHYPLWYRDDTSVASNGYDYDCVDNYGSGGPPQDADPPDGNCDEAPTVADGDYRAAVEDALSQTGFDTTAARPFHWFFGHNHDWECYGIIKNGGGNTELMGCDTSNPFGATGITTAHSVYWQAYSNSGTADPKNDTGTPPLGVYFVEIDETGIVSVSPVSAGGQRGGMR